MFKALRNNNRLTTALLCVLFTLGACSKNTTTSTRKPLKDFERDSPNVPVANGNNWFTLDPELDNQEGVSADRLHTAATEAGINTSAQDAVIVAVIDSGVDIHHEDLQGKIWINEDEIAGNGIDDDNNGYIDDVHGWNYIGGYDANGNVVHINAETLEMTRIFKKLRDKRRAGETLSFDERQLLDEVTVRIEEESSWNQRRLDATNELKANLERSYNAITSIEALEFTFDEMTVAAVESIDSQNATVLAEKDSMLTAWHEYMAALERPNYNNVDILNRIIAYDSQVLQYYYNPEFDPRSEIVGDDPTDFNDTHYGNHDVIGPDADHGTHVAGIIAANRHNDLGIRGIADNVKIMALRAVPNGDERDKDVALAVRYAVDNGARVINMSFGKAYSPFRHKVEEAMQYAADHGVMLVHAAGNDHKNNDHDFSYPIRAKRDGSGDIETWLEVGASASTYSIRMVADFSNYGKNTVDLFAPGYRLESTVPGNQYATFSGTSMASPAAAGVVALIMDLRPELSTIEVRDLLLQTGRSYNNLDVFLPGTAGATPADGTLIPFNELSISGKIASAFDALKSLMSH